MAYKHAPLAHALKGSGLKVVPLAGWRGRGRPASTGQFNPRGILVHHTGSSASGRDQAQWMATGGRPDLPAPLCHIALGKDGTVYLCASGRANHAGSARASGPIPAGDGNALYIGIEAMNSGSEGWSSAQYNAYVKLCAALCRHYGWKATRVRAHKETSTTGKWDPGLLDMRKFRADIGAELHRKKKPKAKPVKRWGPVNRWRVNRALRTGKVGKRAQHMMTRVVWALRAEQGPKAAKGYRKYPVASLRRGLRTFQRKHKLGGNGYLTAATAKKLSRLKGVTYRRPKK